jgi:ferredoxin
MAASIEICVFCPRLCRHVCPVAVASGREAATPTAMATAVWSWRSGRLEPEQAARAASLCTDCGACASACHVHQPLPQLLAQARSELLAARPPAGLGELDGEGRRVAIESDGRRWGRALARLLREPVARLHTDDFLGFAALGSESLRPHLDRLRQLLAGRIAVVSEANSAEVLREARLPHQHLRELLPPEAPEAPPRWWTCHETPEGRDPRELACCGAHHAIQEVHPEEARRVGREAAARLGGPRRVGDSRCAGWLRACGASVLDPVDRLLSLTDGQGGAAPG